MSSYLPLLELSSVSRVGVFIASASAGLEWVPLFLLDNVITKVMSEVQLAPGVLALGSLAHGPFLYPMCGVLGLHPRAPLPNHSSSQPKHRIGHLKS